MSSKAAPPIEGPPSPSDSDRAEEGDFRNQIVRQTVPSQLDDKDKRERWKLEEGKHGRGPYLIELNILHPEGMAGAANAFLALFDEVCSALSKRDEIEAPPLPVRVGKTYYRCELRVPEWRALVAADEQRASETLDKKGNAAYYRCIYKVWPDFPVHGHISQSVATVKADAALRAFEASGERIVWAVIDSGIDAGHPHFGSTPDGHRLLHPSVRELHRCFVPVPKLRGALLVLTPLADPDVVPAPSDAAAAPAPDRAALVAEHREWALRDDLGHGTHVAGIIAGRAPAAEKAPSVILQREDRIEASSQGDQLARRKVTRARTVDGREAARLHGVAENTRLVSLRVLDGNGNGRSSDVIRALEYVRETLNDNPKIFRVHGVNLSVGYEFDAEMFACGQSPLCSEVNRLVQAGVVVVTAAGNTGYGTLNALARTTKVGLSNTINDPGNADLAITVGSTHRESPHTFGVSYFSSKGPTGDGRLKPDLLAPGERIISCAAGRKLSDAQQNLEGPMPANAAASAAPAGASPPLGQALYVEDSGTSMAAPHVSGAIAAFLSIRREFIGRPLEVKKIFLASAIPLGRERYFEGHGLLDLMKAIQSV